VGIGIARGGGIALRPRVGPGGEPSAFRYSPLQPFVESSGTKKKEDNMNIDRVVLFVAGSFVLLSVILSRVHHPYWLWFTAFVGANLLQSSLTGFCPMAKILKAVGMKTGHAFG
jgi:hypothetical protein